MEKVFELDVRKHAPWRLVNPQLRERFKRLFEGENDMKTDPFLASLPDRELEVRRRATEYAMGMMLNEADLSFEKIRNSAMLAEASTSSTDAATFAKWALPLVRKFFPKLAGFDVADVRSVPLPTFPVHTLDHQYASAGGTYAAGTSIYDSFDPDYADDPGEDSTVNKIKAKITAVNATCVSKKLLADYSIEALQDFNSQYGYDLRKEMVDVLAGQVLRERNYEILDNIASNVGTNVYWNDTQPSTPDPWSNATPKEYIQSLWDSICDANHAVETAVYQSANVIVCGSDFANVLEKVDGFSFAKGADAYSGDIQSGPINIGTLKGRYRVIKDFDFHKSKALVIHKSAQWLYTGFVHCVYVPLWISPEIPANTFRFDQGVLSRYVNVVTNGNFGASVTIV